MKGVEWFLSTEEETYSFAACLAQALSAPFTLALQGALGAGKTTFMRGVLRALGVTERIKSPTFSLVESYDIPGVAIELHHFDLYRMDGFEALQGIGFNDYFSDHSICCIEWAERALGLIQPDMVCQLVFLADNGRRLQLSAHTEKGQTCISHMMEHYV